MMINLLIVKYALENFTTMNDPKKQLISKGCFVFVMKEKGE